MASPEKKNLNIGSKILLSSSDTFNYFLSITNDTSLQKLGIQNNWPGNGSYLNPFVIANINVTLSKQELLLENVHSYILMQNCTFNFTTLLPFFTINNVTHFQLINTTFEGIAQNALIINNSSVISTTNVNFYGNYSMNAIEVNYSSQIIFHNYQFYVGYTDDGFMINNSQDLQLHDLLLAGNYKIDIFIENTTQLSLQNYSNSYIQQQSVSFKSWAKYVKNLLDISVFTVFLFHVRDILIANSTIDGPDTLFGSTIAIFNSQNITIRNTLLGDGYYGIAGYYSKAIYLFNNIFNYNNVYTLFGTIPTEGTNSDEGIYITSSSSSVIQNNTIFIAGTGIDIENTTTTLINANHIQFSSYDSIYFDQQDTNDTISNNTLFDSGLAKNEYGGHGIHLGFSNTILVIGNNIKGSYADGLQIAKTDNIRIVNNSFVNNGNYGIECSGSFNTHIDISNNTFKNNSNGTILGCLNGSNLITSNGFILLMVIGSSGVLFVVIGLVIFKYRQSRWRR